MTKYKIYNQDVVSWANAYEKSKFHALLCDPPYELNFMNKKWDNTGVAFQPETWAALANVLHPGAFIMVFSSSRTWHRLATAIEDAGYVLHPSIFLWCQSQGFPKATNISKQLDDEWAIKNFGGWCDCDDNTP